MSTNTVIMVTGVGSGVAQSIIKALRLANRDHQRHYIILGTDAGWKAAGLYAVDRAFLVPRCSDEPAYLDRLVEICRDNKVDFLIPGTDPEVDALKGLKPQIEALTGVHVLLNPPETIDIGYDKFKTTEFLKKHGFPYPETVPLNSADITSLAQIDYPFIVKPRYGSGSVGLALIKDKKMLENHLASQADEMIAQEYINAPENEYTCGLAFGKEGQLLSTIILQRDLKKGFTQFARVTRQDEVQRQITAIAGVLEGRGAYNVQGQLTGKGFVVFEINPRFSGTTAFRAVAGQNEPDIYIQHFLKGEVPSTEINTSLCMSRYLNEYYFDTATADNLKQKKQLTTAGNGYPINYF